MRVLQVIHQFPPHSSQGSEVYCCNLARQLSQTHEVSVFHVSNTRRWRRRLGRATYAGLHVYHCKDSGDYARLADWSNDFLRTSFQAVLDEIRPQVVHFHNYLSLGDDLPSLARATGTAVVYTLHDFGLICPNALLLRDDGVPCGKQHGDFFQDCCPILIRTDDRLSRRAPWSAQLPSLARWRLYSRQHPSRLARRLLQAGVGQAAWWFGDPSRTDIDRKRAFFLTHSRRIFRDVDLFIAPSRFLIDRYVSCGLSRSKVIHVRYGVSVQFMAHRRERSGPIRFGYIGALHPHKGIELLLEAFSGVGERASLHVHGSVFGSPISRNYWRRIREQQSSNVFFHGAYENDRVGAILADLDVVVVPSLWYENSPLTIQEAFLAGVPVITADCGGMAELVRDGMDGLHFRRGDVADLRQKLRQVVDQPQILDRLRRGIPPVPGIEEHTHEIVARYLELTKASPVMAQPRHREST